MIDTRKITTVSLKKWLVKVYGKDILRVFDVHLKTEGGHTRNFKIETKPDFLTNPIVIWIVTEHNKDTTPNGKVMIRNMDDYYLFSRGVHHVSSVHLLYKKLGAEIDNALKEARFVVKYGHFTTNFGFLDLLKFMKRHHFKYVRRTKYEATANLRGIFIPQRTDDYTPSEIQFPEISFDYKTRKVGGYVDGTKKCRKLYNHFASYVCNYLLCTTNHDASEVCPTEISKKTIHGTIAQCISKMKKENKGRTEN